MKTEIIVAGFGGQGVLLSGQLLALAAMLEGRQVTWFPSYGPEMRGGTANCSVIVSDEPIGSPVVEMADLVLAFNEQSLTSFENRLYPGGKIVYNCSLCTSVPQRGDIKAAAVPVTKLAAELGLPKAANMVMLGAALGAVKGLVKPQSLMEALTQKLGPTKKKLLPANQKALESGLNYTAAN